jgi:hypothetical protein
VVVKLKGVLVNNGGGLLKAKNTTREGQQTQQRPEKGLPITPKKKYG